MITKRVDSKEAREFWDAWPKGDGKLIELPYLGDDWWEAEDELSVELFEMLLIERVLTEQ